MVERVAQQSFAAGELSPRLHNRADLASHAIGCKTMLDLCVVPQGGADRIPGSWYLDTLEGNGTGRIIPFVFSAGEAFFLVFTPGKIRIYTRWGAVLDGASPYEVTTAYTADDLEKLRHTQSADVMFLFADGLRAKELRRIANTDWQLLDADFNNGPFLDENPDETLSIMASATTGDITLTATGDIWTEDHVGALWRLDQIDLSQVSQWVGGVDVTTGDLVWFSGRTYRAQNDGTTAPNAPNHEEGEQADSVEAAAVRWLYLHDGFGVVEITGHTSATEVTATVKSRIPDSLVDDATQTPPYVSDGTWRWREGAFSDAQGYPRDGGIWDNRLVVVGRSGRGNTHHLSKSQDLNNFLPGADDDDAITRALISQRVPTIQWLVPSRNLFIATVGREWIGRAGNSEPVATPSNYETKETTGEGSVDVSGIEIDGRVVFFDASGRRMLEHNFDFASDTYQTTDLSVRADHIPRASIRRMVWQKSPHRLLWCVFEDGGLACVTYHREQQVLAWTRCAMGGTVEDIATIPNAETGTDDILMILAREIGGQTVRYIERLARFFDPYGGSFLIASRAEADAALFTRSSLWYEGSETKTLASLDHLEGKEVDICSDGRYVTRATVTGGTVTLPYGVTRATIGLPVTWELETLPYEAGQGEARIGREKQVNGLVLDILAGVHAEATVGDSRYSERVFRDAETLIEDGKVHTGPVAVEASEGSGTVQSVALTSDLPYPFSIRGIVPETEG